MRNDTHPARLATRRAGRLRFEEHPLGWNGLAVGVGVGILWGVLVSGLMAGPAVPPRPAALPKTPPVRLTTRPAAPTDWQSWAHPKGWICIRYPPGWRATRPQTGPSSDGQGDFFEVGFVPPGQPPSLTEAKVITRVLVVDKDRPASQREAENHLVAQLREGAPDFSIQVVGPLRTQRLLFKFFVGEGEMAGQRRVATLACAGYQRGVILVAGYAPPGQIAAVGPTMRAMLGRIQLRADLYPPKTPRWNLFADPHRRFCLLLPETWSRSTVGRSLPGGEVLQWVSLNKELSVRLEIAPLALRRRHVLDEKIKKLANQYKHFDQGVGVLAGLTSVVLRATSPTRSLVYEQVVKGQTIYGVQTVGPSHPTPADQRNLDRIRDSLYLDYSPRPDDVVLPRSRAVYLDPPAHGPTRRSLVGTVRRAELLASLVVGRPVTLSNQQVDAVCRAWTHPDAHATPEQRKALAHGDRTFRDLWRRWQYAAADQKQRLVQTWRERLGWLARREPVPVRQPSDAAEELLMVLHAHWLKTGTGPWPVEPQAATRPSAASQPATGPVPPTTKPASPAPEYFPRLRPSTPGWGTDGPKK